MGDARVIDSEASTDSPLLEQWNNRELDPSQASPFHRHDVLMALRAIHAPDRRLGFAVADSEGGAPAILPYSLTRRYVGPIPLRLIEGPVGWIASVVDFATSGGEKADHAAASALLASDGWDLLEFRGVPAVSALARAFAHTGCAIVPDHDAHAIPLGDGPTMSAKRARNQRRLRRRLAEAEGADIVTTRPSDPDWPCVLEAFVRLHAARWHGTSTRSPFEDPATRARFLGELSGPTVTDGMRAVTIRTPSSIRGVVLAWQHGDAMHAWRLAYDTSLAPYSPGIQLLQGLAESAVAEGRSQLRLGRGDDAYKESWRTVREPQVIIRGISTSARVRLTQASARLLGRNPFAGWRA